MPAPTPVPGVGGPPPFFPWETSQPVPAGFERPQFRAALALGRNWFVRVGASNNNGGSDNGLAALRTGSDGVANNTTTFTSASAAFTSADIGRGICVSTGATARRHRIVTINSGTNVTLDRVCTLNASGQTWAIGGAWADWRAAQGDSAVTGDTNSPVVTPDAVWIGGGTYRVVLGPGVNWLPAAGGQVSMIGDIDGLMTGDAGMVRMTAYTTNDKTTPVTTTTVAAKANILYQNLVLVGGAASNQSASCYDANIGGLNNVTFRDVAFLRGGGGAGTSQTLARVATSGAFMGVLFDRCYFAGRSAAQTGGSLVVTCTRQAGSDYDAGVTVQNSLFICGAAGQSIRTISGGAGAGLGGGVLVKNSTFVGGAGVVTADANLSSKIPIVVTGCAMLLMGSALSATSAGQIVEDYNLIDAQAARANIAIGAHSISDGSYDSSVYFGWERIYNGQPRPFCEPVVADAMLAFGAPDTSAGALDLRRGPRPSRASRFDVGAIQLGNSFGKETGTVHTGSNAISLTGDGYQDFDLAVDAGALTVSVFGRFDSNYVGPLPQLQIVKGSQVGVGDVVVNFDANALNAWEQQSIQINPTAAGIVTVRLISGDTSGIGKAFFDTFAAA